MHELSDACDGVRLGGQRHAKAPLAARLDALGASTSSLIRVESMNEQHERSTITLAAWIAALANAILSDSYSLRSCSPTSGTISTEGDVARLGSGIHG